MIATPKTNTKMLLLIPLRRFETSAMPERSAPMLIVLALKSASATRISRDRGIFLRRAAASPMPVVIPMRAHIICTAPMRGKVSIAVHNIAVPSCAPAIE